MFIKATLTIRIDTDVIYNTAPYIRCVVRAEKLHKSDSDDPIDTDLIVSPPYIKCVHRAEKVYLKKATLTTRIDTNVIYDTAPYIRCVVRTEKVHKSDVDDAH